MKKEYFTAFAVFLLACIAIFNIDLLNPGALYSRVLVDYWPLHYNYPYYELIERQLKAGHFPLWNPYNSLGAPLLATMQSSPFFPTRPLYYLFDFFSVADIEILIRLFACFMFTFVFVRKILYLSQPASLLSATLHTFTGYHMVYLAHAHDQYIFYGLGALLFAKFPKMDALKALTYTSLFFMLIVLAGQPGAGFYLVLFSMCWLAFNAIRVGKLKRSIALVCFAGVISGLLTALIILPFVELIPHIWHYHPAGMVGAISLDIKAGLSALGSSAYRAGTFPPVGLFPYIGFIGLGLAFASLAKGRKPGAQAMFFILYALIFVGLIFGLEPFDALAQLPLLNRLPNFKYPIATVAFCVAILAGVGFDRITSKPSRGFILALIMPAFIVLLWVIKHTFNVDMPVLFRTLAISGVLAVIAISAMRFIPVKVAAALCILLAIFELGFNYRSYKPLYDDGPEFYENAYKPFKEYGEKDWIIDYTGKLPPNLGIIGGVHDIRLQDALYLKRIKKLFDIANGYNEEQGLREFIPYNYTRIEPEKINGQIPSMLGVYYLHTKEAFPFDDTLITIFQEGNVRTVSENHFLLKYSSYALLKHSSYANKGLKEAEERYIHKQKIEMENEARSLFAHAPTSIKWRNLNRPNEINFFFGIDNSRYSEDGDGVTFSIFAGVGNDEVKRRIFSKHIDPINNPSDRSGDFFNQLLTSKEQGELNFITTPGLNVENDWALWSGVTAGAGGSFFTGKHSRNPWWVYENSRGFYRVFGMEKLVSVSNMEKAEKTLKNSKFNPLLEAIVEGWDGPVKLSEKLAPDIYKALITEENFDNMEVSADFKEPGFLVIGLSPHPGWKAYLGDKELKLYKANLAMTGAFLGKGKHTVKLVFKPQSFRIGLWASLTSLVFVAFVFMRSRRL